MGASSSTTSTLVTAAAARRSPPAVAVLAGSAAAGSVTRMVSPPPGVSAAATVPPMMSRKPRTTARPSPIPPAVPGPPTRPSSRWNASNIAPFSSSGTPQPWSTISSRTQLPSCPARSSGSRPRRRVGQRVGEQVGQHPLQQSRVGPDQRQAVGDAELHPAAAVQAAQRDRGDLVDRGRPQERLQRPDRQAAHVQQVADQGVEPVRGPLDRGQQRRLVGLGPGDIGLAQRADARLDRGQRGAQVVADRGQQRGAHPVALGQRLGLRGLRAQPVPVQGRGGLRRVAVQQSLGQRPGLRGRDQDQVITRREAQLGPPGFDGEPELTATRIHRPPARSSSSARPP